MAALGILYPYIYLILVFILTYNVVKKYKYRNGLVPYRYPTDTFQMNILLLFLVIAIGFRPYCPSFTDMESYIGEIDEMYKDMPFTFTWDTDNKIWDNLEQWWGSVGLGSTSFFVLCAVIYFICTYIGIRRLFPHHVLIAYLVFLGAFSTFSYSVNGIKAGCAAAIFIMALGYLEKRWIFVSLVLISWGFHHSMELCVGSIMLALGFKNPKWFYYGYAFCVLMSILHVTAFQTMFAGYTTEHAGDYLMKDARMREYEHRSGFRPDFLLYSIMPVWIGYRLEMQKKLQLSKMYHTLIHFYITANGLWCLCMYAPFTNRIAYLSWLVYPIVIIYPFLDDKNPDPERYKKFNIVVMCHIGFTMLMQFVYYGIFALGT